ncbi:MAG: DUF3489 domain-containing protein [Phenylobacterium sp.]|uniref:DUF3489 domain-containing protein n=1 Tax=Phenylobacterium sp. TaxID=1871053 RepID=UPI00273730AA|nr:DUF3489 domain-containing protein [Phenylobacterium sp.]MDP3175537.1 DUF3489 domain-containing protein [Phenylobacterium sp.]
MTKNSAGLADKPRPDVPGPTGGKLGVIIALLRRPEGADLSALMTATGWQQHSVRGALAGALKKVRGLNIVSEKGEGPRTYRIVEPAPDDAPPPESAKRGLRRRAEVGAPVAAEVERG